MTEQNENCTMKKPDFEMLYMEQFLLNERMKKTLIEISERMVNPPLCVQHLDFKERYEAEFSKVQAMSSETLMQRLRRWWNDRKVM